MSKTYDPIVVNPPREQLTPTLFEKDVRKIVAEELKKVPAPSGGTKLFRHIIRYTTENSVGDIFLTSDSNTPAVYNNAGGHPHVVINGANIILSLDCLLKSYGFDGFITTFYRILDGELVPTTITGITSDTVTNL